MAGDIPGDAEITVNLRDGGIAGDTKRMLNRVAAEAEAGGNDIGDKIVDGADDSLKKNGEKRWRTRLRSVLSKITPDFVKDGARKGRLFMASAGSAIARGAKSIARGVGKAFKGAFAPVTAGFQSLDNQAKAIVVLLASAFGEIATLSSGIAASLTAIAGSIVQAAGAAVPLAAAASAAGLAFALAKTALDEMKESIPGLQSAIDGIGTAWQGQADAFGAAWGPALESFLSQLGSVLAEANFGEALGQSVAQITEAFQGILDSPGFTGFLSAMETTLPAALTGFGTGLAGVSEALLGLLAAAAPAAQELGEQFAAWGQALATSVNTALADGSLQEFFDNAVVSLNKLLDVIGPLGQALFNVLMQGSESGNSLLDTLAGLAQQFLAFTQSIEGQAALDEWFANGITIFNALLPLLGAVGTAMADLVTPELITQVVELLGGLTDFIPILTQVLGVISQLGVLNIFVELLNAVGTALQPLMPVLAELASQIGTALIGAIQAVAPALSALIAALMPAIQALLPALTSILTAVTPVIAAIAEGLIPIFEALMPIIELVVQIITPLIDVFVGLLVPAIELVVAVIQPLIDIIAAVLTPILEAIQPIIEAWADILDSVLTPAIELVTGVIEQLTPIIEKLTPIITDVMNKALEPVTDVFTWLMQAISDNQPVIEAIMDAFLSLLPPVTTLITDLLEGKDAFDAIAKAGAAMWKAITDAVDKIMGALGRIKWPSPPSWLTNGFNAIGNFFAEGGLVTGPTRAVIGEAGPEMVVPLARPLSQVDPAVRDVAAFAQGKMPNSAFARGGVAGAGGITVENVQIVSPWANNPRLVAEDFLDALVLAGK